MVVIIVSGMHALTSTQSIVYRISNKHHVYSPL